MLHARGRAGGMAGAGGAAALGAAHNAGSCHFEDTNYEQWGRARLRELLDKAKFGDERLEHGGAEIRVSLTLTVLKLEGEAWAHVRKGRRVTGYSFDIETSWAGHVHGGGRTPAFGKLKYDLTVDDEDPDVEFSCSERFPFHKKLQALVAGCVARQCATFVADLAQKAAEKKPPAAEGGLAAGAAPQVQVGQYQKYTTGPDGVANLQAAARQYSSSQGGSDADAKGGQKHIHTDKATH